MIKEFDIGGVYVHPFMIALLLAFLAARPASLLLNRFGIYRHIWHPGLFDTALFVILYGVFVCLLVPDVISALFHMLLA